MATYRITTDQGIFTIEGPDDATQEELEQAVSQQLVDQQPTGQQKSIAEEIEPGIFGETSPPGQKILENLTTAAGGFFTPGLAKAGLALAGKVPGVAGVGRAVKAAITTPEQAEIARRAAGAGIEATERAVGVRVRPLMAPSSAAGQIKLLQQTETLTEQPMLLQQVGTQGLRNLRDILKKIEDNPAPDLTEGAITIAARVKQAVTNELNARIPGRTAAAQQFKKVLAGQERVQAARQLPIVGSLIRGADIFRRSIRELPLTGSAARKAAIRHAIKKGK